MTRFKVFVLFSTIICNITSHDFNLRADSLCMCNCIDRINHGKIFHLFFWLVEGFSMFLCLYFSPETFKIPTVNFVKHLCAAANSWPRYVAPSRTGFLSISTNKFAASNLPLMILHRTTWTPMTWMTRYESITLILWCHSFSENFFRDRI